MPDDDVKEAVKEAILGTVETSLEAQLRAVRRLRRGEPERPARRRRQGLSQVDMAYDVLNKARGPLHITDLLARINAAFGVKVDRESLVSSLTKKVARGDRFVRTAKNTFGVRGDRR
jgi:hypothetical protein